MNTNLPVASSATHAHILAVIASELGRESRSDTVRILDAGCGNGDLLRYLALALPILMPAIEWELHGYDVRDSGHVVEGFPESTVKSLSRDVPGVDWTERVLAIGVADVWPYSDGSFDVICSNQVLEHIFDLEHFLSEVHRTLKPEAVSVNVFPLRRVVWECHTAMPLVHRIRDRSARTAAIRLWSRLGFGRYPYYRDAGFDRPQYEEMSADLIDFACRHRSWRELAAAAKHAQLSATHHYTSGYYVQKLRSTLGWSSLTNYRTEPRPILESLAFSVLPSIASSTLLFRKGPATPSWDLTE